MAIAYWKGRHSFIKKLYATKIIVLGKPLCEQEFRSTFVAPEKWTVNDLVSPSVIFDAPKYYICDDPVYFNDLASISFIDKKQTDQNRFSGATVYLDNYISTFRENDT